MQEKRNKLWFRIIGICVLIGFLAAVRIFEDVLFYDPFGQYFRREFASEPLPQTNVFLLILNIMGRYVVNSIVSVGIIYLIFVDKKLTFFAGWLYVAFFAILLISFLILLLVPDEPHKMYLFYIRRFLIQPVLLLLFIPAFYFQKQQSR